MANHDDDFQIVSHRKAARRKSCKKMKAWQDKQNSSDDVHINEESIVAKLKVCRLQLQHSEFISTVKDCLSDHDILRTTIRDQCALPVEEMVLYGLGNFSTCPIARYQLALFQLLSDHLQVLPSHCYVYDPRFRQCEKDALAHIGLQLIPTNEVGKRQSVKKTLYYMPHCGNALYNNLLWANWRLAALQNTVILGNSFRALADRKRHEDRLLIRLPNIATHEGK